MANKIDELWGEALDKAVPDTYSSLTWTQVEKIKQVFAELIVKECISKCEFYNDSNWGPASECIAQDIKQHFGVEE